MRLIFIVLYPLLCLLGGCIQRSHGQILPVVDPYRFATSFFPSDAGMRFRWVASDLSSSPVSSWTDRISGSVMTQATGANQPTWDATGVKFDGSDDFLTITNLTTGITADNWAVLVVLKLNSTAASQQILGNNVAGQIWLGIASTGYFYDGNSSATAIGLLPTTAFDFFSCPTTNASSSYRVYTNGLTAFTATGSWNAGVAWPRLGRGNGNAPFNGNIQEIIVWTNYVWTASQIANVHAYVTNTYGVTP